MCHKFCTPDAYLNEKSLNKRNNLTCFILLNRVIKDRNAQFSKHADSKLNLQRQKI